MWNETFMKNYLLTDFDKIVLDIFHQLIYIREMFIN